MATKQAKQTKQTTQAKVPAGWSDETQGAAGKRGEFFRFEPGATLEGVIVGPPRTVKGKFGERTVRDVETESGDVFTVEPKAFCKRLLDLPAGNAVMLTVHAAPTGEDGSAWTGRLLTKKADVPF